MAVPLLAPRLPVLGSPHPLQHCAAAHMPWRSSHLSGLHSLVFPVSGCSQVAAQMCLASLALDCLACEDEPRKSTASVSARFCVCW